MASDDSTSLILAALERLESGQVELKSGLAELKSAQAGSKSDLAGLRSEMAGLKSELAKLKAGQADLVIRLDRLESSHVQLRTDLMGRMDRLQDALTVIRDDIGVNMGRADQGHRVADNVRDELRALNDVVSGVIRQVQRLQSDVRGLRGDP